MRGCFTALAIAYILQLDVQEIGRMADVAGFVKRCQVQDLFACHPLPIAGAPRGRP